MCNPHTRHEQDPPCSDLPLASCVLIVKHSIQAVIARAAIGAIKDGEMGMHMPIRAMIAINSVGLCTSGQ